jgi:hypothetical protein
MYSTTTFITSDIIVKMDTAKTPNAPPKSWYQIPSMLQKETIIKAKQTPLIPRGGLSARPAHMAGHHRIVASPAVQTAPPPPPRAKARGVVARNNKPPPQVSAAAAAAEVVLSLRTLPLPLPQQPFLRS